MIEPDPASEPAPSAQVRAAGAFRHARSHLAVIAGVLTAAGVALALSDQRSADCTAVTPEAAAEAARAMSR
jgi:hypothetical protein